MRTSYKTKRNSKSLKRIKKNRSKRRYRKSHGGALGNSPFPTDAQPSKKMPTTYQSMSFDELRESYEKLLSNSSVGAISISSCSMSSVTVVSIEMNLY